MCNAHQILRSRIPSGGRQLTSTELRDLRAAGYSLSNTCRVNLAGQGSPDWLGHVFKLDENRRWRNLGIAVQTK